MPSAPNPPRPTVPLPPGVAVVRALAVVVPSSRRADWIAEWEGELYHAWSERRREGGDTWLGRARLTARALGAGADALWLRRHHGGAHDMLGLDLKYAARGLRRRPGFAAVVVLTLALGIGATTAIFSVVNGVLLRPLPFPAPEQLVYVRGEPTDGDVEKVGASASYLDYVDIRTQTHSFQSLAAVRGATQTLGVPGLEPELVSAAIATSNLLPTLGVHPALGRGFVADDERPGAAPVALIGHDLWRRRFGGDPGVVGRTVRLDGVPVTVVGVLPADFRYRADAQIWRPLVPTHIDDSRGTHQYALVGRLRPEVNREQAEREVRTIARRLELQYPADNAKRSARLEPMRDVMVKDARPPLLVLFGAVGLVLLIGCANLASLFLARAAAREREVAVRTALGAGQGRLLRQFLTESLLLTLVGGAAGLGVAWAGMRTLLALAPRAIPRADEVALDTPVLLFLLGASVVTGLVFGLLPALQLRRGAASVASLKDGARGATPGVARRRLRHGLVVGEVALATLLVVGAALLLKSFWRLQQADPGFVTDGLLVAHLELPSTRYDDPTKVTRFFERLRRELETVPDARSVAVAYEHPLSEGWTSSFTIEGREKPPVGQEPEARVRPVQPGYFRTVGVRLLRGRDLSDREVAGGPGAVVINEAFARRHFPNEDPIGRRLARGSWFAGMPSSYEIVGVVADEPFLGLGGHADPATYFAHAQFPMNGMWVIVRARGGDPLALAAAVRERVWRLDAELPLDEVRTMRDVMGASVAEPRFMAALLSLFAGAALLLAAIGTYGVLSYTVAQRTGEIGVRMALGAPRGRVMRLVVGEGVGVALLGVALGTAGALALARVLASLLHEVSARDPLVFAGVASLLTLVVVAAAYLPARRASRIEPVVALRYE
ncbi:MAG TPA: ABC transporter permease [Gemmatimonadaceae bacterium]|nr:ABC transporter permease [Gemmatimonadaceae bacterium]